MLGNLLSLGRLVTAAERMNNFAPNLLHGASSFHAKQLDREEEEGAKTNFKFALMGFRLSFMGPRKEEKKLYFFFCALLRMQFYALWEVVISEG